MDCSKCSGCMFNEVTYDFGMWKCINCGNRFFYKHKTEQNSTIEFCFRASLSTSMPMNFLKKHINKDFDPVKGVLRCQYCFKEFYPKFHMQVFCDSDCRALSVTLKIKRDEL